jgi:hypothetical protein
MSLPGVFHKGSRPRPRSRMLRVPDILVNHHACSAVKRRIERGSMSRARRTQRVEGYRELGVAVVLAEAADKRDQRLAYPLPRYFAQVAMSFGWQVPPSTGVVATTILK